LIRLATEGAPSPVLAVNVGAGDLRRAVGNIKAS
jgi:hypothetical protein